MATLNAYASSLVDTPVCTPVSTDFHLRFWETDTKWTQALKIKHGFKSSWNISFPCSFFTSPPPLHTSLISSTLQIFCYQVSPQCPIWPKWESNKMMETGRFHLSSLATRRNPHLDGHWHMRMHHWALDSTEEIPVSNKTSKSRVYAVRKAKIALLSSSHHSWSSRALCRASLLRKSGEDEEIVCIPILCDTDPGAYSVIPNLETWGNLHRWVFWGLVEITVHRSTRSLQHPSTVFAHQLPDSKVSAHRTHNRLFLRTLQLPLWAKT